MKKILLIFALLLTHLSLSQTTIFNENFGVGNGSTYVLISSYTGWQNVSPITFTGTADIRTTSPSDISPSSGGANVFFTNVIGRSLTISGINTSTYSEVTLSLNHHKSTTASSNELIIEVSSDGINFTQLTYSRPTGTGTAKWLRISPSGTIPITTNLRIRFRQSTSTSSTFFRIDDIELSVPTPLPVELTYFDGIKQDGFNLLKWQTASEYNSSHFIVEKSTNGNFELSTVIGNMMGSGYSQEVIDYDLLDMKIENTINYYRLKQYDFDGEFKIYPIITIDNRIKKDVVKIVDLTGREVNQYYKGWVIIYYDNGEVFKTYQY